MLKKYKIPSVLLSKIFLLITVIFSFSVILLTSSYSRAGSYFTDDMESGGTNWVADPPWKLTTLNYMSPNHCWTDSESGNYQHNLNISLTTSTSIDLSTASDPQLTFWHNYQLESDYDFGYVEISEDNENWEILQYYTGSSGWRLDQIDLSSFIGLSIYLRFRLKTDYSVKMDGWQIDDVCIGDQPEAITLNSPTNVTYNSLDLTWTQSTCTDFAYYAIYRSKFSPVNLSSQKIAEVSDINTTTYQDTTVARGTTYYYKIYVVSSA